MTKEIEEGAVGMYHEPDDQWKEKVVVRSERRMHLATRLENMGLQLHGPHRGYLITEISSVNSLPTLDEVEVLVEQLEKRRRNDSL